MERILYFGIEYFVMFYALLIAARLRELYKNQQSLPPFLQGPVTVDEFLGPEKHRNEYWLMPLWAIVVIICAAFITFAAAGCIAIAIGAFLLLTLMRTLWNALLGSWAYWSSFY